METVKEAALYLALAGVAGSLICLLAPKNNENIMKAATLAFVLCAAATPFLRGDSAFSQGWSAFALSEFGGSEYLAAFAEEQWKSQAEQMTAAEVNTLLLQSGAEQSTVTVKAALNEDGIVYAKEIYIVLDENCKAEPEKIAAAVTGKFGIIPTVRRAGET